jgi:protocatechuate 3,4-dioxygenase beta subunit
LATGAFLQGFAFVDGNHDGQLDANDPRLGGAIIKLYSGATLVGQVTTGADGSYRFDNLNAGAYTLVETPPAGYGNSAAQAFSNLNPATVVSPSTIQVTILDPTQLTATFNGLATSETLQFRENGTDHVAGVGQMSVILNGAGGVTEPALSLCADVRHTVAPGDTYAVLPIPTGTAFPQHGGQIAYLYNHYGTSQLSSTDAAGLQLAVWELEYDTNVDLSSGDFVYEGFAPPTTDDTAILAAANFYLNDSAGQNESAIFLDETFGGTVVPSTGQGMLATGSMNFGNNRQAAGATISGTKFEDIDGSGVFKPGDPGIAGVTIYLDANNNGVLDPGEVSTTTDANGNYQFTNLAPGTYYVREVVPPGFIQTTPYPAPIVVSAAGGGGAGPQFGGQTFQGVNFGNFKLISISGVKFVDTNADGAFDTGKPGLAGVTVFLDANNNGVLDPGEPSTTTDANGHFQFNNVGPGSFTVREVPQPGWVQTTATQVITALSGQDVSGADIGNFQTATISGTKFLDTNGGGVRESGEPGLAGVTIFLDANHNGVLDPGEVSTTTDANGHFQFTGLLPGTYYVREVLPAGYMQTTTNPTRFTVTTSGQVFSGADIGNFQLATISGTKFLDTNGSGVFNAGKPGLAGVTIFLDANNNGVLDPGEVSTTTDVNGRFQFTGLAPGTYSVREVVPPGYIRTTPNPAAITVTTSGQVFTGVDLGNFKTATISGAKFEDIDGSGAFKPGDPGLAGVTIFLDANNNGVLDLGEVSTTTDANGHFQFTGLLPGAYYVREVLPPGSVRTTTNPASITVTASGQVFSGVDFGNFQLISISGTKFQDTNGNGVHDAGEPGLPGVTIFLDANNNGILDPGEASTTTDANGNYQFTNLGPGAYYVRELVPSGWTRTTANPGPISAVSGHNVTGVDFGNEQTAGQGGGSGSVVGAVTSPIPANALIPVFPLTGNFPAAPLLGSKVGLFGSNITANMTGMLQQESNFVSGLYQTTLGRSPDAAGLTFWVQMLQGGLTRATVTDRVWESPEHRSLEVSQFYTTFLHRPADSGGLAYWTNALLNDATEEQVMLGILASGEYQSSHGSDVAFVNGLYNDVLARNSDSAGQAYWLQALSHGASRLAVAQGFLTSQPAEQRVLDSYYAEFLGRNADAAGELYWLNQLQAARASFGSIADSFLASDEFFARTAATH